MRSRIINFLVLIAILIFGIVSFWNASGDKQMQMIVGGITCALYFVWGMIHHILEKDFHPKIVVEYLLVSLIAFILIVTIIWT